MSVDVGNLGDEPRLILPIADHLRRDPIQVELLGDRRRIPLQQVIDGANADRFELRRRFSPDGRRPFHRLLPPQAERRCALSPLAPLGPLAIFACSFFTGSFFTFPLFPFGPFACCSLLFRPFAFCPVSLLFRLSFLFFPDTGLFSLLPFRSFSFGLLAFFPQASLFLSLSLCPIFFLSFAFFVAA